MSTITHEQAPRPNLAVRAFEGFKGAITGVKEAVINSKAGRIGATAVAAAGIAAPSVLTEPAFSQEPVPGTTAELPMSPQEQAYIADCDRIGTQGITGVRGGYVKGSHKKYKVAFGRQLQTGCDSGLPGDVLDVGNQSVTFGQEVKKPGSSKFVPAGKMKRLVSRSETNILQFVNSPACDTSQERKSGVKVRPVVEVKWDSIKGRDSVKRYTGKAQKC